MIVTILFLLASLCFFFSSLGVAARVGWGDLGRMFFCAAVAAWVWGVR